MDTYHILIESGKEILISNCKRITSYTPEMIELSISHGSIKICGIGLTLCDFFANEIQISGKINSIEICEGGKSL